MSRNGSGVYSLPPGSVIANGQTSDATDLNTPLADIASDLNVARPVVAGGTGAANASDARTNLGVAIGSNVQAFDATLTSLAALGTAADKIAYTTGVDTWAEADLTAAGRELLDDADAEAQRTTLELGGLATLDILDEDDFASDSATRPPSQQSTKAYVDGYTSSAQTITSAGLLTLSHGLSYTPAICMFRLKCTTTDGGYSVGDEVIVPVTTNSDASNSKFNTVYVDGTNVYVRFTNEFNCFSLGNKTTGAAFGAVNSRWELYVEARR